jgi:alpha-L-fucosidase
VRRFVVEARTAVGWTEIWRGTGIGHKKLERFSPIAASALRLRVEACVATPLIRSFAAYEADPALFSVPMDAAQRSLPTISRDQHGMVSLGCSNPDLPLRYTTDGSEPDGGSTLYTAPFPLHDGGTVRVFAGFHPVSRSTTVTAVFGIDRRDWKVVSVSLESPYRNDGHAGSEHLLNDDPRTYWHTYHADRAKSAPPHEAVLDMGCSRRIAGFTMTPRAGSDATPDRYEFHLSQDGATWTLAASGTFANLKQDSAIRLVPLARPMSGRYLRFVALHALDDVPFIAVAGLGIVPAG